MQWNVISCYLHNLSLEVKSVVFKTVLFAYVKVMSIGVTSSLLTEIKNATNLQNVRRYDIAIISDMVQRLLWTICPL